MKKIQLSFFILSYISFLLFSPNTIYAQGGPGENNSNEIRQASFILKNIVVPTTPEAASLGKYGDVDVNRYTGALGYGIPLYTIQGKHISMPISLSYDGSGNKVESLPTWVGLGWTLQAGGVITKVVQANPDTESNYYTKGSNISAISNGSNWMTNYGEAGSSSIATNDLYQDVIEGVIETQPDNYYYNFNGNSGKFYFKPVQLSSLTGSLSSTLANNQSNIIYKESKDVRVDPYFASSGDRDITSFTAMDAKGNKYYFTATEETKFRHDDLVINQRNEYIYNSAWYLTKIESAIGDEEIVLEYQSLTSIYAPPTNPAYLTSITYQDPVGSTQGNCSSLEAACGSPISPTTNYSSNPTREVSHRKYLSRAILKIDGEVVEQVDFETSGNGSQYAYGSKQLDNIIVRRGPELRRLMKKSFTYDQSTNRLTLKQFQEYGQTDSYSKPAYEFEYNTTNLPAPTSNSLDHWGYFNGANNSSLVPSVNGFNPGGAIRSANSTYMKAGILTQVTYPTGGYSKFTINPHKYREGGIDKIGGGLRVEKIRNYHDNGELAYEKIFKYHISNTNIGSSGLLLTKFSYDRPSTYISENISNLPEAPCNGYTCNRITLFASPVTTLGTSQGSHIGYSRVEEINAGKTVYFYKNNTISDADYENQENGQLFKKEVYDLSNKLVAETTYEYAEYPTENRRATSMEAFKILPQRVQGNATYLCTDTPAWISQPNDPLAECPSGGKNYDSRYYKKPYTIKQRWMYLKKQTETLRFHQNGGYSDVATEKEFTYGNENVTQPTLIKVINSDGKLHEQLVSYPDNSNESHLLDAHMLAYPITTERKVDAIFQYGTKIDYDGTKKPYQYFEKFNGSAYFLREHTLGVDANFNITEAKREHDVPNAYIWTHYKRNLGAKIQNASDNQVAFAGFETPEINQGGWIFQSSMDPQEILYDKSENSDARTGYAYFDGSAQLDTYTTPAGEYIVSYYRKSGGSVTTTPTHSNIKTSPADAQGWIYEEKVINLSSANTITVNISNAEVDELRLFPSDALMTTYSYDQHTNLLIGMADANSIPQSFVYDPFNRLIGVLDMNQDYLAAYEYAYDVNSTDMVNQLSTYQVLKSGVKKLTGVGGAGTVVTSLSYNQVNLSHQYVDGLGRSLQNVLERQSPAAYDVITPFEYDSYGRAIKSYLPYTLSSATNGAYRTSPMTEQSSFYSGIDGGYGYTEIELDDSPLNRVEQERSPGSTFRQHPKEMEYGTNGTNEVRKFWTSGYYPANELMKVTTLDEDGHSTTTFTDKLGRTVMMDNEGLKTYYLYDDFGNLKVVIPPKSAARGHQYSTLDYTDSVIEPRCYIYTYDSEQRMSTKKIPGADTYTYKYDRLDRPVLTIDGKGFKFFTKYDILDRPIITGKYTGSASPIASEDLFENKSTSGHYYTLSNSFPINNCDVYSVSYYDDYDIDNNNNGAPDATENYVTAYTGYPTPVKRSRGKLTVSKTGILKSNGTAPTQFLYTRSYYDIKNRVVQVKADNQLAGTDIIFSKYLFPGWLEKTRTETTVTLGSTTTTSINQRFEYDHVGRLLSTFQQIDGESAETKLVEQVYDERDFLSQKKLHKTSRGGFLQTLDYQYNIRGWLKQINDNYSSGDMFDLKITYGNGDSNLSSSYSGGAESNWNGNITMMEWRTGSAGDRSIYGFFYDDKNRMEESIFAHKTGANSYDKNYRYSTFTNYDDNGNITQMHRKGEWGAAGSGVFTTIDNIFYSYNQDHLTGLTEYGSIDKGFKTNAAGMLLSMTYDNNGNMISDNHKNISTITYNYLNLPIKITFSNGDWLEWTYDAAGNKLKKEMASGNGDPTYYVNNLEYDDTELTHIYHLEGFLEPNGPNTYKYFYYLKDHLGNNRVVFQDANGNGTITSSEITEEHYYPFGMQMQGAWGSLGNPYQYNGKELNEEFGLNWLSYGAREYDPAVGRFMTIDRFAEKYTSMTPYQYGANNPIINIDVNGDSIWVTSNTVTHPDGSHTTTQTINGTVKLLDLTGQVKDLGALASQFSTAINKALKGSDGNIKIGANISVEAVSSMSGVDDSDHLMTIVDDVKPDGLTSSIIGIASRPGKVGYTEYSKDMMNTMIHEFGHNLGLKHNWEDGLQDSNGDQNFMSYGGSARNSFSNSQIVNLKMDAPDANQGRNYSIAKSNTNNMFWHTSSNLKPYLFNVRKGNKIPRIIRKQ